MTSPAGKGPPPGAVTVENRTLFGTPIAVAALPHGADLNGPLEAEISRLYQAQAPHDPANLWVSPPGRPGTGDPVMSALCTAAGILIAGITRRAGDEDPARWRIETRCHVLSEGQSVAVHSHPEAAWEATYVVAAEPSAGGELEFQDPRGAAPVMYAPHLTFKMPGKMGGGETLGVSQTVAAKPGLLAVYPGWLMHGVGFCSGAAPRLSVTLRFSPPGHEISGAEIS